VGHDGRRLVLRHSGWPDPRRPTCEELFERLMTEAKAIITQRLAQFAAT